MEYQEYIARGPCHAHCMARDSQSPTLSSLACPSTVNELQLTLTDCPAAGKGLTRRRPVRCSGVAACAGLQHSLPMLMSCSLHRYKQAGIRRIEVKLSTRGTGDHNKGAKEQLAEVCLWTKKHGVVRVEAGLTASNMHQADPGCCMCRLGWRTLRRAPMPALTSCVTS